MRQGYLQGPAESAQPSSLPGEGAYGQRGEGGEALRSLAGARMYLFDTCERLFVRRDPAMAQHFRQALRAAEDRSSMFAIGDAMLDEVTLAACAERGAWCVAPDCTNACNNCCRTHHPPCTRP